MIDCRRYARSDYLFAVILASVIAAWAAPPAFAGWSQVDSKSLAWLRSVYFVDQNNGWIVGSNGTFLATTDGGKTWRADHGVTSDNIRDVYFSDMQNGWLLCERDVYNLGSRSPSYLRRTSDGGATWESIELKDNHSRLVRFFFDGKGAGFAFGEGSAVWELVPDMKNWKPVELPTRYLIFSGHSVDALGRVLVGAGGTILRASDGGSEWKRTLVKGDPATRFNSVFFIDQKAGWVVGNDGAIYATGDGGASWDRRPTGVTDDLTDVYFLNAAHGFAVGDHGRVLESETAGQSWQVVNVSTNARLEKLFFVGGSGFAVGYGGTILKYTSP